MDTYRFRLAVNLPDSQYVESDSPEIRIDSAILGRQLILRILGHRTKELPNKLVLLADGFDSAAQAAACAHQATSHLKVAFALEHMGLEIASDEQIYHGPNHPSGCITSSNLRGLVVYPSSTEFSGVGVEITGRSGTNIETFTRALSKAFNCPPPSGSLLTALDLYMDVPFQATLRARYFQLVTVVECLSQQERLPSPVPELYKRCKTLANELLPPELLPDWLSRLGQLKKESISASCVRLIKTSVGEDAATEFRHVYGMRSTLLHGGDDADGDLRNLYNALDSICLRLIVNLLFPQRDLG
jgi:hypothetical protein